MTDAEWVKFFPIHSICRLDLKTAGLTEEQIVILTDEDIAQIAELIGTYVEDYYFDRGFWWQLGDYADRQYELRRLKQEHDRLHKPG